MRKLALRSSTATILQPKANFSESTRGLAPEFDGRAGYSPDEFCDRWPIGRTLLYGEVKRGRLRVVKIGKRTIITAEEERRYLALLEAEAEARRQSAGDTGGKKIEAVRAAPTQAPTSRPNLAPGTPVASARTASGENPGDSTGSDAKAA